MKEIKESPCKKCPLLKKLAPLCHSVCNELLNCQSQNRSLETGLNKKFFNKTYFGHRNKVLG